MIHVTITPFQVYLLLNGLSCKKCASMSSMDMYSKTVFISTSIGDSGWEKQVLKSPKVIIVAGEGHFMYSSWKLLMADVFLGEIYHPKQYLFIFPYGMHQEMTLCPYFRMFSMVMYFLSRKHKDTTPWNFEFSSVSYIWYPCAIIVWTPLVILVSVRRQTSTFRYAIQTRVPSWMDVVSPDAKCVFVCDVFTLY